MRTRASICALLLAFCHVGVQAQTSASPPEPAASHTEVLPRSTAPQPPPVKAAAPNSTQDAKPGTVPLPAPALIDAPLPSAGSDAASQAAPIAQPLAATLAGVPVTIHALQQEKQGDSYKLQGEVEIDYKDYVLRADRITYNSASGDVVAEGHLQLNGGPDSEDISASHGVMNLNAETGTFYDVIGSIGVKLSSRQSVFTTPNPFLMSGKQLIKEGPDTYELIGGSMTSCQLPKPHWRILAPKILVDDGTARAWNSEFRLLGFPILYLPYVTHAVNTAGRQSGLLTPELEIGSVIKGTVLGSAYYWAINRSTDLTVGLQYYSLRGFEQSATFRFRGQGNDFVTGVYTGLEDRGLAPLYVNQGGQDTIVTARRDLNSSTRAVLDAEYLSSYAYRQVFAENFSLAVSSEVKSWGFLTHEKNGLASSLELERYQNYASDLAGDQIHILHVPNLELDALDRQLGRFDTVGGGDATASILSRSEPFYRSHNVGRLDLFPHLSMPWIGGGWTVRPTMGLRETLYSHSQELGPVPTTPPPPVSAPGLAGLPGQNAVPTTEDASLTRQAFEADVQILPPVVERDFSGPYLAKHFGVALRHTIEPELNYRYVTGVENFNRIPRFDSTDVYSNTNEVEYGVTQRLFLKRLHPKPCDADVKKTATPNPDCGEASRQWLSWFVGQKYFADPTFGGAVISGRRNVFTTTLDFSGVAYITAPRSVSPIVSRLRASTSAHTDLEWDFDYDTKAGRMAASNVFANYRHGNFFSSFGSAVLNAVAEIPMPPTQPANFVNYNQIQLLLGYGALTKPGLSAAASGGFDLDLHIMEYTAAQATYNFDCCGFTAEYRRFQLGTIRNESQESFSFTLAGVGAAGNLKRAERLF